MSKQQLRNSFFKNLKAKFCLSLLQIFSSRFSTAKATCDLLLLLINCSCTNFEATIINVFFKMQFFLLDRVDFSSDCYDLAFFLLCDQNFLNQQVSAAKLKWLIVYDYLTLITAFEAPSEFSSPSNG